MKVNNEKTLFSTLYFVIHSTLVAHTISEEKIQGPNYTGK